MIAPTPPMGWNSWNTFGGDIHETLILEAAEALVRHGLRDAGYQYVVIDDLWEADERDADGNLTWDPVKFPRGIPWLADQIHDLGLKFGIYSCAGTHTCAEKPGSFAHEEQDALTFAQWGVDFLKYDFCYNPLGIPGKELYRRMGQALRATGRDILFSACEWGVNKPWEWAHEAGCHMWRTTGDIADRFDSVVEIGFMQQAGLERYAGPNRWNDPDMLVVGMRGKGNVGQGGCTDREYKIHFAHWCMLAAPLMIGCDVRDLDEATLALLRHPGLLAINQDSLGRQGFRIGVDWDAWDWKDFQVWAKPLHDGSIAVMFSNLHPERCRRQVVAWEALGLHDRRPCRVTDVITGADLGMHRGSFTARVAARDALVFRLTPIF